MSVQELETANAVNEKQVGYSGEPDFQRTELGPIPVDWSVKTLRQISPRQSVGLVINPSTYFDKSGNVPLLVGSNVHDNWIDWESARCITRESNEQIPASRLNTGDLVMVRVGEPGVTAVIPADHDGCNCASMMIVRQHKSFDSQWLCYVMNSFLGRAQVDHVQYGTAQKQFNISDAVNFLYAVPPLAEQEAIAEALGDADALVESLERLLAKKRNLKQAAMQQLLTGKKRLPGFEGEWETAEFGDVITHCSSGATPYRGRSDYYKGKVRWISSAELNYNVIHETEEHISHEAVIQTNLKLHPAGTFLIAITGLEAAGTRGSCGIVGAPSTTNQSCMAIFPNERLKTSYLYHYYVFRGDELALKYCQGTKQQSYTAKLVKLLPIELPSSTEEQIAITAVLSDMDEEITAVELKIDKARQIKAGMMQELLTGRTRLVPGRHAK